MVRQYYAAIILIVVGIVLFLEQFDLIYLTKADYIIYGSIFGGLLLLINGISRTDKKGVLGGSFFLSYGIILLLMNNNYFIRDDEFGVATFFLSLSLANFVYFLFKRDRITNIVFGLIFGVLGGAFLVAYYDYYPSWYIAEQIEQYWPVALILLGLAVIFKAYRKQDRVGLEHQI